MAKQADLLQLEIREKQASWSKGGETGRPTPTGNQREASELEQKQQNRNGRSNWKIKYAGCKFGLPRMGR